MRSACFCSIVVGLEHQSLQQGKTQRLSFELEEIRSHALLSNKQSLEKMASIIHPLFHVGLGSKRKQSAQSTDDVYII